MGSLIENGTTCSSRQIVCLATSEPTFGAVMTESAHSSQYILHPLRNNLATVAGGTRQTFSTYSIFRELKHTAMTCITNTSRSVCKTQELLFSSQNQGGSSLPSPPASFPGCAPQFALCVCPVPFFITHFSLC